ncbi:MAG TPA: FAD-binding oxidoreductase, partial [Candidatus Hydrogenedentes bacterium]|nr:FAD-binding oxidoreductase [Candidatus Hydrogenedentota bacterium]
AIANDVHGKNHHRDGSFSRFVRSFELLTPGGEVLTCSPEQNADVFWATVGGVGLTGFILTARLELLPVESAYIKADYLRAKNLDEALAAMAERDQHYQYAVAWVDCLASGKDLGRSVLMWGDHARVEDLKNGSLPLGAPQARPLAIPIDFPACALNPLSIKAFNTLFYAAHPRVEGKLVDYDRYFYPLDRILDWNRMYGKRGFVQFQATVPLDGVDQLAQLLDVLGRSARASFLSVLKRFGDAGEGLLSHPIPGYTLTLDLPNKRGAMGFLDELHRIVLDAGGRVYLAKDAAVKANMIAEMYPRLDEFREVQARLDPDGVLSSSMARRLDLVGG